VVLKKKPRIRREPIVAESKDEAGWIRSLLAQFAPRRPIAPSKWQELYRFLPPHSPRAGKWHNDPFQVEPLDTILEEGVASLTLMWCSQFIGKSSIVEGILGWQIAEDPSACVCVHPTGDNAKVWSKNRFSPLIESIPALRKLVDRKSRSNIGSGENTVSHKLYPGGFIVAGGANSAAQLCAHTARITAFDEVDRYPAMVGKVNREEGDVIVLVEQRSARFRNAFSIKTSTPTVKGFSRIEEEFGKTDQRKFFVRCLNPKCKHEFVILWNHIKCPEVKDEKGEIVERFTSKAYLECPKCATHYTDVRRQEMVRKGKWIATNPKVKNHRGYWANAFLVLGPTKAGYESWMHYFWDRYLSEKEMGTRALREWQNLVCAETYEIESIPPPDFLTLYNRREYYDEFEGELILPERVLLLTVGIDVQHDRVELETVGWGLQDESWGVEYRVIRGNPQLPKFWDEVDGYLKKAWRHPSGHWLSPYCTLIDSGDKPHPMYAFVRKCAPRLVFASKGFQGFQPNWCNRSGGSNQRLFILKTDTPKENLYSNLRLTEYGPGFCHFPSNDASNYDTTYFDQLTAERLVQSGNFPHFELRASHIRNEALDVRVLAMGAREIADPNWAKVQSWIASTPSRDWRPKPPPPPVPVPPLVVEDGALVRPGTPPPELVGANSSSSPPGPRRIPGSGWSRPY
jgi:phage terminase large subunit GpA-like protein